MPLGCWVSAARAVLRAAREGPSDPWKPEGLHVSAGHSPLRPRGLGFKASFHRLGVGALHGLERLGALPAPACCPMGKRSQEVSSQRQPREPPPFNHVLPHKLWAVRPSKLGHMPPHF